MARKGQRQKKARAPKKSNRVGLSTTASTATTATTPTTTTEAPKKTMAWHDRELRRLMGAKVKKT